MSTDNKLLTPLGRLVQGSLYAAQTTDMENRPLQTRDGKPREDWYFALAIPKTTQQWQQTEWGALIVRVAQAAFPQGQFNSPTFAWKIIDGDSQVVNIFGRKPCEYEGWPGHWILKFSSGFKPTIVNADGTKPILEDDYIKVGDYVQVFATVSGNDNLQKPGIYLNHSHVSFQRYGEPIVVGIDPKTIGFGKNLVVPAEASLTPIGGKMVPPHLTPTHGGVLPPHLTPVTIGQSVTPSASVMPPPHTPILNVMPAAPIAPARTMTPKAGAFTYEQFIAQGWTDQKLIAEGYMVQ